MKRKEGTRLGSALTQTTNLLLKPFFLRLLSDYFGSDRSILDPSSFGLSESASISITGVMNLPSGHSEATIKEIR